MIIKPLDKILWYYYDEGGNLVSFELNGTSYYYVKNLQGNIIDITDDSGNKVVEYVYDSWDKLISTTNLNLRYELQSDKTMLYSCH